MRRPAGVLCLLAAVLTAPRLDAAPEVWLVTYGPGDAVWERFGHNALWLRDPDQGLDHLFNFGYFDWSEPAFLWRFIQGHMTYYSAAMNPAREFDWYRQVGRSVALQPLVLRADEFQRLAAALRRGVQPEHRRYVYDYFTANCSTRVRDALDRALGGGLAAALPPTARAATYRSTALAMVDDDVWLALGMHLALGRPAEKRLDDWRLGYLPQELARAVGATEIAGRPLAGPMRLLSGGQPWPPPWSPHYGRFAALGVAGAALFAAVWVGARRRRPNLALLPLRLWFLIAGLGGLLLAWLWGWSAHWAAHANENLLLLTPLALVPAISPRGRWAVAAARLIVAGAVVAVGLKFTPGNQVNHDLLLWLVPWQFTGAALLIADRRQQILGKPIKKGLNHPIGD